MHDSQAMTHNAVVDVLYRISPCTMDELIMSLSMHKWGEVLFAVGTLAQEGRVSLQRGSDSGYRLSLAPSAPLHGQLDPKSTPVCFCLGCGYLCDEIDPEDGQSPWIDAHQYLTKYGGTWMELNRRNVLCPACARLSECARQGRMLVQT